MKNFVIGSLGILTLFFSSCKDDNNNDEDYSIDVASLVTPEVSARVADPLTSNPFTGILEIFPCNPESSIYYGNFVNDNLSSFSGYYVIVDGSTYGAYNRLLHLPTGNYNIVYWGTPKYDDPIYNAPAIKEPGLTIGADLSELYFSLRPNSGDTTYMPVYDLVHAVQEAHIGIENLQAPLQRVGAGIKIIAQMSDDDIFNPDISDIEVLIGGIAEKINFYTAVPENMTKTVKFNLELSDDSTMMSNPTVMLFPSSENPSLTLIITLKDGSQHTLNQNLNTPLSANTRLTLNVVLGEIHTGGDAGNFTIEDWNESTETIEFPIID
ncbi:MAG TPA: FimB/Mfa2 family fimbrial subunit [Candidatus Alistipes merdigallinarum]|nr:FimB/Mfa2 family fimbrial subunit [Candidatus Alistipes merdigallinarum]